MGMKLLPRTAVGNEQRGVIAPGTVPQPAGNADCSPQRWRWEGRPDHTRDPADRGERAGGASSAGAETDESSRRKDQDGRRSMKQSVLRRAASAGNSSLRKRRSPGRSGSWPWPEFAVAAEAHGAPGGASGWRPAPGRTGTAASRSPARPGQKSEALEGEMSWQTEMLFLYFIIPARSGKTKGRYVAGRKRATVATSASPQHWKGPFSLSAGGSGPTPRRPRYSLIGGIAVLADL
jgi:hypothetical protein